MNTNSFLPVLLVLLANSVIAQDLTISNLASVELTKEARSGRYGGTLFDGNQAKVIYVFSTKDSGADVEEYTLQLSDASSSIESKFIDGKLARETMPWFIPQNDVENLGTTSGKWLEASRAFGGGMKLNRGHIQKNYMLGVYTGMQFISEESIKPKTGDIWRITPGGYKSLSDLDAMATENGFYKELHQYGNPLIMPADATLLAAGVITEKVSLRSDQEFAANRVAVLTMNGLDFEDLQYDIYLLPFTALTVTSGLGQDNNLCSLFAPLNGPTTLKSLQHLLWKDAKDYFTLMRFDDQRQLVDSVSFRSELMWADYSILNGNGYSFVLGKGNAKFDNWYRGLAYTKLSGMQVVKIKDGKVVYQSMFDEDAIEEKLVGAGGGKVKFDLYIPRNDFREIVPLPNGDELVIGQTPLEFYALQISPSGNLEAFYIIPLGKQDKLNIVNYQYMLRGDDVILSVNLQPVEFSTDAQVTSDTFKSYGAGVTTTITTTTVKKLNEVYLQSMMYRLNTVNHTLSNPLELDGKDFYTMGSFPAMFTRDAVYFTGKEKGPKGKKIFVAKVDL